MHDAVELRVLLLQSHHARPREHNLQVGKAVVALAQARAPVVLLENLVDEQHPATLLVELGGKLLYAIFLEEEIVEIHIQALTVAYVEMLFRILKQEGGLAHTTGALDADQTVVPVDLVHQTTSYRSTSVLYKVRVSAKEGIHSLFFDLFFLRKRLLQVYIDCKDSIFLCICKV